VKINNRLVKMEQVKAHLKFLITGGAGYIGSHVLKLLGNIFKNSDFLTIDNLYSGHKEAVLYGKLVVGDVRDRALLTKIFSEFEPDVIMHFSAFLVVPESVEKPVEYWDNNVGGMISLLSCLLPILKKKKIFFIFSSTAAVYGNPEKLPIPEEHPTKPENPYGETKLVCEKLLRSLSLAEKNFKFVSLRYFNAAGADPEGMLGQSSRNPTHLILRALKVAKGEIPFLEIYGKDYPTPDGTCIRDYIHIQDLSYSHILALKYMLDDGESDIFNVGYGKGYSVLEVLKVVDEVVGFEIPKKIGNRRPGDPAALVADPTKIKNKLGFSPKYDDLHFIVKTAWNWELNRRF
jgi:UDP-glucose 4-epimerase